jgi:hypothetical protein
VSEDNDNVVQLNIPQRDPKLGALMNDLAEVVNRHVAEVPAVAVIGALEFIKQDVAMQVMELFEDY